MEPEFGDTMFPGGLPQPDQRPDALGGHAFEPAQQESPPATAAMPPVPPPAVAGQASALTARQMSARAIKPGCSEDVKELKKWKGDPDAKPRIMELQEEIHRRDPAAKPTYWPVAQMVAWLTKHSPPEDRSAKASPPLPPAEARAQGSAATNAKKAKKARRGGGGGGADGDGKSKSRWKASAHLPRLCHAIVQNKEAFLKRFERPKTREELEAAHKKSSWLSIAATFNDECGE